MNGRGESLVHEVVSGGKEVVEGILLGPKVALVVPAATLLSSSSDVSDGEDCPSLKE